MEQPLAELPEQKKSPAIILVGYRTRMLDDADKYMPKFQAPSNYKDEAKITAYLADKASQFVQEAKSLPYISTFDEVRLIDSRGERPGHWYYSKERAPGGSKQSICLAVRNWLLKSYPDAWSNNINFRPKSSSVIFLGFEPRRFLKLLACECSLPENGQPLPLSMWYAADGYRDIGEACVPNEFEKFIDWSVVFKRRGIKPKTDWTGPGNDPEEDVRLIAELAAQLGMLRT
jgi:hypothetical protein